jgi:hypothetical protein
MRPTRNLVDHVSVFMPPSDRVAQLYLQTPGSSGGILTRLHGGRAGY